jgi:hypothetical protein
LEGIENGVIEWRCKAHGIEVKREDQRENIISMNLGVAVNRISCTGCHLFSILHCSKPPHP